MYTRSSSAASTADSRAARRSSLLLLFFFSGGGMRRRGSAGEEPAQAVPRLPEGALGLDPLEEADAVVLGGKPPLTLRGRAVRRFCSGGGEAGVELGAHQRVEVGLFFEREFFFSRR